MGHVSMFSSYSSIFWSKTWFSNQYILKTFFKNVNKKRIKNKTLEIGAGEKKGGEQGRETNIFFLFGLRINTLSRDPIRLPETQNNQNNFIIVPV